MSIRTFENLIPVTLTTLLLVSGLLLVGCQIAHKSEGQCLANSLTDCTCTDGAYGIAQCLADESGYDVCVCGALTEQPDASSLDTSTHDIQGLEGMDSGHSTDDYSDLGGYCFDPQTDCIGLLPEPYCDSGIIFSYTWECNDANQCVIYEEFNTCDFGCAPPERGNACARLAYSTGNSTYDDLCIIEYLGDDSPICFNEPGQSIRWHPTDPDIVAYSTLDQAPWIMVIDLEDNENRCELRELGRDPAVFLAGSWLPGTTDQFILFKGDIEDGYSLSDWTLDFRSTPCLTPTLLVCTYLSGPEYSYSEYTYSTGSASSDSTSFFTVDNGLMETLNAMTVSQLQDQCNVAPIFTANNVSQADWKNSEVILYISDGILFSYRIHDTEEQILADPSDGWGQGLYTITDYNFDGSVIAATATDETEQGVYIFRLSPDGSDPVPWPNETSNRHEGPLINISIERFQSD
jgi:hypothetical protein